MSRRPLIGYLETLRRIGVRPDSVQVLGEALPQSAARRWHWCGSLMACGLASSALVTDCCCARTG